jgi:hypothetical protein
MKFDLDKVRANVRQATTEDLLDRATVYRDAEEPEALDVIEAELRGRGVRPADLAARAEAARGRVVEGPGGVARACERCHRPAVWQGWDWHRLWGVLPVFPRRKALCEQHRPAGGSSPAPGGGAGINPG